ncbi:hypothetical protein F4814DRAFT_6850 [Daldinia grandis]|nr:hypothetical protein F4814DRAFT_6850 [Daldinia grandis]
MVGSDIATDFITLIAPIPLVWRLQMSTHRKLLASLTFMIGALSVGASIAKGYIYISASLDRYTEDAILILTGLSIWNLVEVNVGIVAASGPTLRVILAHALPTDTIMSLVSSVRSNKSKGSLERPGSYENSRGEERLAIWKVNAVSVSRVPGEMTNLYSCETATSANMVKAGH